MTDVKQPELEQAVEREYPLPHSTGVARLLAMRHGSAGSTPNYRAVSDVPVTARRLSERKPKLIATPVASLGPRVTQPQIGG